MPFYLSSLDIFCAEIRVLLRTALGPNDKRILLGRIRRKKAGWRQYPAEMKQFAELIETVNQTQVITPINYRKASR